MDRAGRALVWGWQGSFGALIYPSRFLFLFFSFFCLVYILLSVAIIIYFDSIPGLVYIFYHLFDIN